VYTDPVTRFLQQLSGFFFYALGLSFFVAYVLVRNRIGGIYPAWWLQVADLPLALAAVTYGGVSLYQSVTAPGRRTRIAAFVIGIPLVLFFAALVAINFWKVSEYI
jgi:hypothetical protein